LDPESKLLPPNGNTILHIVGPFVFEAINNYHDGFEQGKAAALEVVLSIFDKCKRTKFDPLYLGYFYRGIERALSTDHQLILSTVITHSTSLFYAEFPGAHVLVPTFLYAIERILTEPEKFSPNNPSLRSAAIKILCCFTCYPEYYPRLAFPHTNAFVKKTLVKSYEEMTASLNSILLDGLKCEVDSNNLQALLWTASVYAHASIDHNASFCNDLIRFILQRMLLIGFPGWTDEVMLGCLQILIDFSCLNTFLKEKEESAQRQQLPIRRGQRLAVGSFSNSSIPFAAQLVPTICKFFEIRNTLQASSTPPSEELIIRSLFCLMTWIMSGDWVLKNLAILKNALAIIDTCRREVKGIHNPTFRIKEAAVAIMCIIINHHANFPPPIGPSNVSSLPTEADLLTQKKLTSKNISCFLFNRTIMSCIRESRISGRIANTIIFRDLTGKYVWNACLNYFPSLPEHIEEPEVKSPPKDPLDAQPAPDQIDYLDGLMAFLTEEEKKKHESLLNTVTQREKDEAIHLRRTCFGHKDNTVKRPRLPPQDIESDTTASRILLAHLGMLSLDNRSSFSLLQSDPAKPFNFLQNFKSLDAIPERDCLQIGVIYVPRGRMSMSAIFDNEKGVQDYFDFLSGLGWAVNLNSHKGFTGGLDPKVTGEVALYYADVATEAIFHVSTMMPNRGGSQLHKRKLILADRVLISWVEDILEYHFEQLEDCKAGVNIVINPLPSGMFRVRSITKPPKVPVGPLVDEVIVSKHILPSLVRLSAINTSRWHGKDLGSPFVQRRNQIEDFVRKHKVEVSLTKFYASQFSMAKG